MIRTAVVLGVIVAVGVMLATVQTRIEIVREGYRRARLESRIEAEQARIAVLTADLARRTTPGRLRELARIHGLDLRASPPVQRGARLRRRAAEPRSLLADGRSR